MNTTVETPEWQQDMKDDIGENPARFLDQDIPVDADSPTSMFIARVRGIDRLEVVGAWLGAERRLAAEQDRQPRDHVINLPQQRRESLQENGERPKESRPHHRHELPERYQPHDRDVPPKDWYRIDEDGERVPWSKRPTGVSTSRRFNSSTNSEALATDGGEPRDG